jgi:LysM repeat protein
MGNFSRLLLFLLGLFLIIISLTSLFDLRARVDQAFALPTPFTYAVTATETPNPEMVMAYAAFTQVAIANSTPNPATATVGAAFTQVAAFTSTSTPILTAPSSPVSTNTPVMAEPTGTPTPTPTVFSKLVLGTHVVRSGEYLYCIGRAYEVVPEAIAEFNSLLLNAPLAVGQVLLIPDVRWVNIPPGRVCEAQFDSPYSLSSSLISTSVTGIFPNVHSSIENAIRLVNFVGPNEVLKRSRLQSAFLIETSSPPPVAEARMVYIDWPTKMHLGESDVVTMTFNPGTRQTTESAEIPPGGIFTGPTSTPDPIRDTDSSDLIDIPDLYDDYRIFAIARLDSAGLDYSPSQEIQKEVRLGENLQWRWSIEPQNAQTQKLIISLRLHYEPKAGKEPRPDEDVWDKSYLVNVKKNLFEAWFGSQAPFVLAGTLITGITSLTSSLKPLWQKNKAVQETPGNA